MHSPVQKKLREQSEAVGSRVMYATHKSVVRFNISQVLNV